MLDLRRPIYKQTAAYGHFGRNDIDVPWEKTDKVEMLKKYMQLTAQKSLTAPVLAQRCRKDFETRPEHEQKSEAEQYANVREGLCECEARSNPVSYRILNSRKQLGLP